MNAPKSSLEPAATRRVKTDGVPMAPAIGSAVSEAADAPELPQAGAAWQKGSDGMHTSAECLRRMIDTIPTLAWACRPDGTTEFLNRRWLDYTGISREQALGWGWQIPIHPDDLGKLMDTWLGLLAAGEAGEEEARLRRFDGAYRWFLFRAVRDAAGVVVKWYGTNTDIEDLKRADERHQGDQRQIRWIIDALPQQIVVLGPDGETLYVNQGVLDYTGLTLDESQGEAFRVRVFHPEDVERVRDERRQALAHGAPFTLEQRARRHDGQYRWFIIRYKPLRDDQGHLLRWYATGTDSDDHKQAAERMRNENLALREDIDRTSMSEEVVVSSGALRRVVRHGVSETGSAKR